MRGDERCGGKFTAELCQFRKVDDFEVDDRQPCSLAGDGGTDFFCVVGSCYVTEIVWKSI